MTGDGGDGAAASETRYVLSSLSGDVLLVGGYGVGNVGDEAILDGLLRDVSPAVDTLSVVTHDAGETETLHGGSVPRSVSLRGLEPTPARLIRALGDHGTVVVGGGGIFSRYMGPYAGKVPYYALAALALGRSVHWSAVGVYPSTPARVAYPLRAAMNRSGSVTVRDRASLRTLADLGVRDASLVPDPATRLRPDREAGRDLLVEAGIDPDRPVLGVAARRVLGEAADERLQDAYDGVAGAFADRGWQLVYLPFCRHRYEPVGQDDRVCLAHAARHAGTVLWYERPAELLGAVSHLDAVVATRLHSMIFAHEAGVPFVAVEYADKVTSILEEYGVAHRGVPLADVSAERLVDVLDEV